MSRIFVVSGSALYGTNGEGSAGGRVDDQGLREASGLGPRDRKKMDRFAMLAVGAVRDCARRIPGREPDWGRTALFVGNMCAGWAYTEPQLRALYNGGLEEVTPYLASAWFPAAAQGQISIHCGVAGYSKTITTDRCAGLQAVKYGYELLRTKSNFDGVFVGGVEAPVTPFVEAAVRQCYGDAQYRLTEAATFNYLSRESLGRGEMEIVIDAFYDAPRAQGCCQEVEEFVREIELSETGNSLAVFLDLEPDQGGGNLRKLVTEFLPASGGRIFEVKDAYGDSLGASSALAFYLGVKNLVELRCDCALILSIGRECMTAVVVKNGFKTKSHNN